LTELGYRLGVVDEQRWTAFNKKRDAVGKEIERLKSTWVHPNLVNSEEATRVLGQPLEREYTFADLLRRPHVTYADLMTLRNDAGDVIVPGLPLGQESEQVEIQIKYEGYIARQKEDVARQKNHGDQKIPEDVDYATITSLSFEARQKLSAHRPQTVGAASRISGITPAAISCLLVYLRQHASVLSRKNAA
jgi:tRNA uridine 5-carboxymethylaminomethyl modification enzyme